MKKENKKKKGSFQKPPTNPLTIEIDLTKYAEHIATLDLTEDECNQLLLSIWMLMQEFVDYGFGVLATPKTCGKDVEESRETSSGSDDMLCSERIQTLKARSVRAGRSAS